ncbi:MAG: hypothetical protein QM784_14290 [Polyangiaceae bacterium]
MSRGQGHHGVEGSDVTDFTFAVTHDVQNPEHGAILAILCSDGRGERQLCTLDSDT